MTFSFENMLILFMIKDAGGEKSCGDDLLSYICGEGALEFHRVDFGESRGFSNILSGLSYRMFSSTSEMRSSSWQISKLWLNYCLIFPRGVAIGLDRGCLCGF